MSLMQPPIDELLKKANDDKFLLCSLTSERARDINDMMHGLRDRAIALESATQIAQLSGRKPLSVAMDEVYRCEVSYDHAHFMGNKPTEETVTEIDDDTIAILDDINL
jgi:DNA-directed RNA polymerase subunit omega